ncbi:hypothetical protein Bca52824_061364 [Brassica carinata]|uniref:Oleosin n=1 Tax=Brassica carinata TaxID=52824 RepID=A0A8X7QXP7_BRACI|nr:hypothetical protein Bca52824_061364 [Brassica carinata]
MRYLENGSCDFKNSRGPPLNRQQLRKIVALIVGVPVGGSLLALAGLTLAGSVIGLMLSVPLFLLFSPVIVPAAITIGLAVTAILASGLFGLTGLSSVSWVLNYLRGTSDTVPEQLDYAKRRMADAVGYAGQKGKEMGQYVQDKAHEAHDTSLTTETTEPGKTRRHT